ncbi:hypothetical protein RCL1_001014 [Eukaryota sp. TZLM3-RCL]
MATTALRHLIVSLKGRQVTVKTTDKKTVTGILQWLSPLNPPNSELQFGSFALNIVLRCALIQPANSYQSSWECPFEQVVSIAADVSNDSSFSTDSQISSTAFAVQKTRKRDLTPFVFGEATAPELDTSAVFNNSRVKDFDQLKANNIPNTFNEEQFTTKIDTSDPAYPQILAEASVIEAEYLKKNAGKTVEREDVDEEVRYSAVQTASSTLVPSSRSPTPSSYAVSSYQIDGRRSRNKQKPLHGVEKVLVDNHMVAGVRSAPTSPLLPEKILSNPIRDFGRVSKVSPFPISPQMLTRKGSICGHDSRMMASIVSQRRHSFQKFQKEKGHLNVTSAKVPMKTVEKVSHEFSKFTVQRAMESHSQFREQINDMKLWKAEFEQMFANHPYSCADETQKSRPRSKSSPGLFPQNMVSTIGPSHLKQTESVKSRFQKAAPEFKPKKFPLPVQKSCAVGLKFCVRDFLSRSDFLNSLSIQYNDVERTYKKRR